MPPLSPVLDRFKPSTISIVFSLAAEMRAQGRDIIDLSIGEPDFSAPENAKAAGIKAIEDNDTKYTPTEGTLALRKAIAMKLKRDNKLDYAPSEIVVDSGLKPLIFRVLQAIIAPDNEVIIPVPCWASYTGMTELAGGHPVLVDCPEDNGFLMRPQDLEAAITPNTRALILNTPSNPTGAAYDQETLKAIGEVMLRHPHVWVLCDEIYEAIVFDNFVFHSLAAVVPGLKEQIVVMNGAAKGYAMTGWRIGYAAGPKGLMDGLKKILSQGGGSPPTVSQAAMVAALEGPQDVLSERAASFQKRRDQILADIRAIPGLSVPTPQGAFYVYVNCGAYLGKATPQGKVLKTSTDLCAFLIEAEGLAVVPGEAFEKDPYFRISYASAAETLKEATKRLARALKQLK